MTKESPATPSETCIVGATCANCGFRYYEYNGRIIPCPVCALSARSEIAPKGWRLVPEEPTTAMMHVAFARGAAGEYNEGIWKAMLAAAPCAPSAIAPKWIPVSERLPTETRDQVICLAYTPTDSDGDASVPGAFVASYDGDGEWNSRMDTGCWEPGDVTHWMPFPEGPK